MAQTVRDAVRALMRDWKLTTVFGNPGSTELAFLADWPDDFRYVLGLQESSVVAMADAFAQLTGNAAVVNLHSAGGLGHGLGSLVTAFHNRAPVLVIAGQQARSLLPGDPFLGALEAAEFPKPYVKWSCQPARAEDVPAAFARAYLLATQAPRGPVFLSVPADDWDAPAVPVPARPRIADPAPDQEALSAVASALDASTRPALVVGAAVDADDAVELAVGLAEKTNAAVWAAPFSARSSFPEDHPLFSGFLPPNRGGVAAALAGFDCVVVLGAPAFTYHVVTESGPELPEVHVLSDDPHLLARAAGNGVLASPRAGIARLTELVRATGRAAPEPRRRPARVPEPVAGEPLSGAFVYQTLADLVPANALVVEEAPTNRQDMQAHFPITARGRGYLTMSSGVLGYGLPAAVGAALAEPARPVVAVLGDGGSMYGIQALWTAARQQTAVLFVILDNGEYAAVRRHAVRTGAGKVPGIELGGLEFRDLARGMGCAAHDVRTPAQLRTGVTTALASAGPTLLHVRLS
ncbi:benzoylformate decarboxylase [Amycolatopsis alkalitolerans]|uniref:Benzoylformate decarboxylase n=1 Tax=Amycolatopsis alkalitolerans TaxID=2547244 RepID=A0A5C4M7T7_9PSEU|nr:benzoylformate decarboxylase [Amycolatopsis alkalitolerans]TNC28121.1 benzoylformate decarboxylase [Amycolatopsis alkalitolerans]